MKILTFDIETEGTFLGNGDFSNLEITVVGVHDSETNTYSSYLKSELPKLWPLLESADLLVGYNSEHFDIPILNKYYSGDLSKIKSVDLLKEVKSVIGRRLKLDNLAQSTLNKKKSGNGLQAQKWWQEGQVEKVREYCLDDVRITRELYAYAKEHGVLKYMDFDGPREVRLNTSTWEEVSRSPALTRTLPF